jgi:hypothetical protein
MRAAFADGRLIDAEGMDVPPLLMKWGAEWAQMVRDDGRVRGNARSPPGMRGCAASGGLGKATVGTFHAMSW